MPRDVQMYEVPVCVDGGPGGPTAPLPPPVDAMLHHVDGPSPPCLHTLTPFFT